jgi:hypothetical protein
MLQKRNFWAENLFPVILRLRNHHKLYAHIPPKTRVAFIAVQQKLKETTWKATKKGREKERKSFLLCQIISFFSVNITRGRDSPVSFHADVAHFRRLFIAEWPDDPLDRYIDSLLDCNFPSFFFFFCLLPTSKITTPFTTVCVCVRSLCRLRRRNRIRPDVVLSAGLSLRNFVGRQNSRRES